MSWEGRGRFLAHGTCGSIRAVLSRGAPTLAATQAYRLTLQYRTTPLGSATSGTVPFQDPIVGGTNTACRGLTRTQ